MAEAIAERRRAARLAAIQGLYQVEFTGRNAAAVADEFTAYRLTGPDRRSPPADAELFHAIVVGAWARRQSLGDMIAGELAAGWRLERLDPTVRAILYAGVYELAEHPEIPPRVTINEYVGLAHDFATDTDTGFVNGVLDRLARQLRGPEMPAASKN